MQQHDITPHFETIKEALGDKVGTDIDADDLKAELQKYLDYGVPPEQAVRTILRHHGVQGGASAGAAPQVSSTERTPLADVPGNVPAVNILVRVLSLNTKTVNARGEEKEIVWGMLGDETATRPYTSWRPLEGIEKGDVLAVQGAYSKEFRSEVQLNFGDRCQIEKKAQEDLPKTPEVFRTVTVAELQPGLRGIEVTGRIIDVAPRDITVQGESKTIYGGTFADESGKIEFTCWADVGLEEGKAVTIKGGYVRSFRGAAQFNFDQDADIQGADTDLPDAETLADTDPVDLDTLVEKGGNDVAVIGTLLEVRDGSGLVFRDPESNRVVHGSQINDDSIPDLRIKGVLDDGTAAMSLIANRGLTEQLLGNDLEECQAMAKEAFRSEIIQEQLQEKLAGRVYKVRGNVLVDEYGAMFIARSITPFTGDVAEEAQAMLDALADAPADATGQATPGPDAAEADTPDAGTAEADPSDADTAEAGTDAPGTDAEETSEAPDGDADDEEVA